MIRTRRLHSLLIGIAAIAGVLLLPAGASAAGAPCDYRDMLDAAANGRQISPHTVACYQKALSELPSDVDKYLPAARANLLYAMRRDDKFSSTPSANARVTQSAVVQPAAAVAVRGPVTDLLAGLGPAHVDEVPTPVFVLGGAAALLLLAGLATSLARVRARRRLTA